MAPSLRTAKAAAAAERLQQTLLLRVLLAKSLQNLAEVPLAAASTTRAIGRACAPWTTPATHWQRRRVVGGEKIRRRGHPK